MPSTLRISRQLIIGDLCCLQNWNQQPHLGSWISFDLEILDNGIQILLFLCNLSRFELDWLQMLCIVIGVDLLDTITHLCELLNEILHSKVVQISFVRSRNQMKSKSIISSSIPYIWFFVDISNRHRFYISLSDQRF